MVNTIIRNKCRLTPEEKQELAECETTFWQGAGCFIEAGRALKQIQDDELYRDTFPNFASYCKERLDCSESHAYRLIAAARIAEWLTPIGAKLGHPAEK